MSREILLLVDALAHEKNFSGGNSAVEEALASATKKKYPDDIDIIVEIDQETGEYKSFRKWTVIPEELIENNQAEIPLGDEKANGMAENEIIV